MPWLVATVSHPVNPCAVKVSSMTAGFLSTIALMSITTSDWRYHHDMAGFIIAEPKSLLCL